MLYISLNAYADNIILCIYTPPCPSLTKASSTTSQLATKPDWLYTQLIEDHQGTSVSVSEAVYQLYFTVIQS